MYTYYRTACATNLVPVPGYLALSRERYTAVPGTSAPYRHAGPQPLTFDLMAIYTFSQYGPQASRHVVRPGGAAAAAGPVRRRTGARRDRAVRQRVGRRHVPVLDSRSTSTVYSLHTS